MRREEDWALQPLSSALRYRQVRDRIRDYILDHRLRGGDPLPSEGDLVRQLEVSRNAVREGLRALEAYDMQLHRTIFSGVGNRTLLKLFDIFSVIYRRTNDILRKRPRRGATWISLPTRRWPMRWNGGTFGAPFGRWDAPGQGCPR